MSHISLTMRSLYFIVNRSGRNQLMVLRGAAGLELPAYESHVPEEIGFADPDPFNAWFEQRYGIRVVRRYPLDYEGEHEVFFVMETCEAAPAIFGNALWISPTGLDVHAIMPSHHRDLIAAWRRDHNESATMPFSRPGGYAPSLAWMRATLTQRGRPVAGEPQQIKNAYVSTVFRCPTVAGDVYLKIIPPVFMREAHITARLAEWKIAPLPEILAIDPERGLLLTADMGGCDLKDCCTLDRLEAVVRELAQFHIAATRFVNPTTPWPFYDGRTGLLEDQIEALFDEAPALLAGSPYALNAEETAQLRRSLPTWKELCAAMWEVPLPLTIDHGDMHPGNIRVVADGFIFYDWAWSAVAHPFIGIASLLRSVRKRLSDPERDRNFLRDTYLDAWTGYASGPQLRRTFDLADRALPLTYVAGDAAWLREINFALRDTTPGVASADACTLRWRQFFYAKVVRQLCTE
jgi:hypothetical protein